RSQRSLERGVRGVWREESVELGEPVELEERGEVRGIGGGGEGIEAEAGTGERTENLFDSQAVVKRRSKVCYNQETLQYILPAEIRRTPQVFLESDKSIHR